MKAIFFCSAVLSSLVLAFSFPALAQSAHYSSQSAGAGVFNAYCAVCHGVDGTGSPTGKSLNAPNLRSAAVQKQSSAALARYIREGKDRMPSFKSQLTSQQIAEQAAYIRWLAHHKVSQ